MRYCDLHTHSTASDGTTPPAELPALARRAGLSAVALTDHDTTAGLVQCAHACEEQGVQFVPGIEVSADPGPAPPPPEVPPAAGSDSIGKVSLRKSPVSPPPRDVRL